MYEPRSYRHWVKDGGLVPFNVAVKETDLLVHASKNLRRKTLRLVLKYRHILESYIEKHPDFLTSLKPLPAAPEAPGMVRAMLESAGKAGVGPMASVAGAMAEFIGEELTQFSPEVIVENGGDIYLQSLKKRTIGIYAGSSPLSGKIGLSVEATKTPLGICTSSGTVGHSLSFGRADAVVALAKSATLADACATAIANLIKEPADIEQGLSFAQTIEGLSGTLIIIGEKIACWGEIEICPVSVRDGTAEPVLKEVKK